MCIILIVIHDNSIYTCNAADGSLPAVNAYAPAELASYRTMQLPHSSNNETIMQAILPTKGIIISITPQPGRLRRRAAWFTLYRCFAASMLYKDVVYVADLYWLIQEI